LLNMRDIPDVSGGTGDRRASRPTRWRSCAGAASRRARPPGQQVQAPPRRIR
jgi:hypothetical protein